MSRGGTAMHWVSWKTGTLTAAAAAAVAL